jgi:hypothetical protein
MTCGGRGTGPHMGTGAEYVAWGHTWARVRSTWHGATHGHGCGGRGTGPHTELSRSNM